MQPLPVLSNLTTGTICLPGTTQLKEAPMRTFIVLIVLAGALFLQLAQWLSPFRGYSNSHQIQVPVDSDDRQLVD